MLTLDLKSDGAPGDVSLAKSLEFNLGLRVTLNGQAVTQADVAPVVVDEPHPVLEKDVVHTPDFSGVITTPPIPSFTDLLNQQVPSAEVTESSP